MLPQELQALIKYIEINKASDLDWFTIKPSNKEGTHWTGKVRARCGAGQSGVASWALCTAACLRVRCWRPVETGRGATGLPHFCRFARLVLLKACPCCALG